MSTATQRYKDKRGSAETAALQRAIEAVGSVTNLATRLGVGQTTVSNWKTRGVPGARCRAIERVVAGRVTRKQLRPDLYGD